MHILVVGAGPTGLTAALELARHDVQVSIVDKKKAPSEISRAVGIMPASIDKLRPTGVGEAIERESILFDKLVIHRGQRRPLEVDFSNLVTSDKLMKSLPQNRTEALMSAGLERLGVSVRYDASVAHIINEGNEGDEGNKVRVGFADGSEARYDWLVAADGAHSTVRQELDIPYLGYDLPQPWSIADVDMRSGYPDGGVFSAWLQRDNHGNVMVAVPIGIQRLRIIASTADVIDTLPAHFDVKHVRRSGNFTIAIRQAKRYQQGRVLLAGDAAHCHSPVGGKGMNLGIDDAVAAARAILANNTTTYSYQRHLLGARVIRNTERVRKLVMSPQPWKRNALHSFLSLLPHSRLMQRQVVRAMNSL